MRAYPFLVLCGLVWMPVFIVGVLRRDLRMHIARMAMLSLPFAFSEFLFYPLYWDPPFLFDFARKIGFGIEDFLFVAALGAMAIGVYPLVSRKRLQCRAPCRERRAFLITGILIGAALLLVLLLWWVGIPAIYSAPAIMLAIAAVVLLLYRRDLWRDACQSGVATLLTYGALCFVLAGLLPGVFEQYWHTSDLLNRFAGPVPVEELIYGFAAGFAAATIYPFAFRLEFIEDTVCSNQS